MSSSGTPRCVVPGCDGLFMTSQPGPYYLLRGRDHNLLVDWLRACKYPESDIERKIADASSNDVICASHFNGRKFRADVANQRVPSVFQWAQYGSEENSMDVDAADQHRSPAKENPGFRQMVAISLAQDAPPRPAHLSDTARRLSDLIASKRAMLASTSESQANPHQSTKKTSQVRAAAVSEVAVPSQPLKPAGNPRCIVPECDGYFRGENTAAVFKPKYFTLPVKDERMLQDWLLAIGISPKSDLSAGKICCTHFKDGIFNPNDPVHRMPIVFAPRQGTAAPPTATAEEPKRSGLKPNMKPHFVRKPVPEQPKTSESRFGKGARQNYSDGESLDSDSDSSSDDLSSGSDSDSDSKSDSSSVEMVSVMPKLHSAAVASSTRQTEVSVTNPADLCKLITNNYAEISTSYLNQSIPVDEEDAWRSLVDIDVPSTKSFGFGKFLFSLGLNLVRRRVYKTALKANARQEKKERGIVLPADTKLALETAVDHFDSALHLNELDKSIETSKLGKQVCNRCPFTSESRLVVDWHRRQPHFDRTKHGYVFCCMCPADQQSMKITLYREHLRYSHGCSFVAFDLFSQPYQCHYCTVCCASWKILLAHMNNCRLTFNVHENLRPDFKTDQTFAVNLSKPPTQVAIDRQLHFDNAIYQALYEGAIKLGLRNSFPLADENVNFVDLSTNYGLPPVTNARTLVPLGFDDNNQEFAGYFGYLPPPTAVDIHHPQIQSQQPRTTILQVPQSTAIVQIVHQPTTQNQNIPPLVPPVTQLTLASPVVAPQPVPTFQPLFAPRIAPSWQPPRPPVPAAPARFSFAPPSELPSSFRPIRVAKLPEITMATIAAATAASRPPPSMTGNAIKQGLLEPLQVNASVGLNRDAPSSSIIKRPEPPFSGANSIMPMPKRFRQTEFCLTTMQRLLFCELCRGIVQEREALRIHLFWAHRIGLPPSSMLTDEWYTATCHDCGVGFYTPDGIERHMNIGCYNDIFVPTFCVVCHKFLSTSSLLCAHLAREHGLTPPSMTRARVCFICSSAFDTEEHCADHLRLGHQVTTEQNAEREDFINVIWQGQLVACVDPEAIGVEAAAAMLSLQAAAAFAQQTDDGLMVEKIDDSGSGALGSYMSENAGVSSANKALYFAARGSVAAPFRRGPGRPPLHSSSGSRGRPRGSRARGPYRPRGTRGPYRPRGSRTASSGRGPGRPPLTNSASKRAAPKRRAPRDPSAAGKAQWFHEEYSLSETDEEDYEPGAMLEADEPDMDAYDEGHYDEEYYDSEADEYQPARRKQKYY